MNAWDEMIARLAELDSGGRAAGGERGDVAGAELDAAPAAELRQRIAAAIANGTRAELLPGLEGCVDRVLEVLPAVPVPALLAIRAQATVALAALAAVLELVDEQLART